MAHLVGLSSACLNKNYLTILRLKIGGLMKTLGIVVLVALCCPAFASNQFAGFNGSYEVVGQDCVYQRLPDGTCSSSVYATEVVVSGDSKSGLINVINDLGGFSKYSFNDERTQNLPDAVVKTIWVSQGQAVTNRSTVYYPSIDKYFSWSVTLEPTSQGLKLAAANSGRPRSGQPAVEAPWFVLYLQPK